MKRALLIGMFIILLCVPGYTAQDPVGRATQHYAKHQYKKAFDILYAGLGANGAGKNDQANLSLGMICLANAELYRELYRASIIVHKDYFTKLIDADNDQIKGYLQLYLAKTLLEAGDLIQAAGYFKKCLTAKNTDPSVKTDASIGLGTTFYLQGKSDLATKEWSKISSDNTEVATSLALAYSRVGLQDKEPLVLCRQAFDSHKREKGANHIRVVNNTLGVYAREGAIDDGLKLIQQSDLKAYFHEETLAKNKVLRFYDPSLFNHLALLYGQAAVFYLQEAARTTNQKLKWPAQYHLAIAHGQFGSLEKSSSLLEKFMESAPLPPKFKYRAAVQQATNQHLLGNTAKAKDKFDELLKTKYKSMLSAEILLQCSRHQLEYGQAVRRASEAAQQGAGKPFARVNHALGKYYLWKKDYLKSATLLEAARDKSNKNRIEFNDPLLLIDLSIASYRVKHFSESLEIYFEMSKQFPAVRQIQMALQGVYSMEQKSAGDAKIF